MKDDFPRNKSSRITLFLDPVSTISLCVPILKMSTSMIGLPLDNSFLWPPSERETHEERKRKVGEWRKVARRLIVKKQRKSKAVYDLHRKSNPINDPGDLVPVSRKPRSNGRTKKFLMKFIGPYQMLK